MQILFCLVSLYNFKGVEPFHMALENSLQGQIHMSTLGSTCFNIQDIYFALWTFLAVCAFLSNLPLHKHLYWSHL